MRIRFATDPWSFSEAVPAGFDSANASVLIPWVEIDGRRVTGVQRIRVQAGDGIATVRIDAVAAVEMVTNDGQPEITETPRSVVLSTGTAAVLVEALSEGHWMIRDPDGRTGFSGPPYLREPVYAAGGWDDARRVAGEVLQILAAHEAERAPFRVQYDELGDQMTAIREREQADLQRVREASGE